MILRAFKLKSTYPDSPKKGFVVVQSESGGEIFYEINTTNKGFWTLGYLLKWKKFWEEIKVEKKFGYTEEKKT